MWVAGVVVVLAAASIVTVSVASSSSDSASAPGVTKDTIVLGSHQPLTGPAAPGYRTVSSAANAFFKYINAHGGVYGRSIVFNYQDDGYDPVNTVNVTRQLVERVGIFAMVGGLGSETHQAVVNYLDNNGVPDLFVESGCTCFNSPQNLPDTFGYFPDYKIEGKILGQYVNDAYPSQKVAYIYQDDDLGQNSQQGLNEIISTNLVVTSQSYDANYLGNGLGAQVAAAKAGGAKVIVIFGIPAATALVMLAAAQLDYHPAFVVTSVGADPATVAGLITQYSKGAADPALIDGMVTDDYLPQATDPVNPWIALFKQVHDTYDVNDPFNDNTVNGMAMAYGTYQALRAAGPNLTRQGLLAAIVAHGSTFQGPNLGPYGFSATDHNGMQGLQLGVVKGGKVSMSGSIYITDDQDAPVTTYTGPHPPPPTSF